MTDFTYAHDVNFPHVPSTLDILAETVANWRRRAQERRFLAQMSEREIRDLGITPAQVAFEAAKPFWRG